MMARLRICPSSGATPASSIRSNGYRFVTTTTHGCATGAAGKSKHLLDHQRQGHGCPVPDQPEILKCGVTVLDPDRPEGRIRFEHDADAPSPMSALAISGQHRVGGAGYAGRHRSGPATPCGDSFPWDPQRCTHA